LIVDKNVDKENEYIDWGIVHLSGLFILLSPEELVE